MVLLGGRGLSKKKYNFWLRFKSFVKKRYKFSLKIEVYFKIIKNN
jgi:hypothetical protein